MKRDVELVHFLYFSCLKEHTKENIRDAFAGLLKEIEAEDLRIFDLYFDAQKKWGKIALSNSTVVTNLLQKEYLLYDGVSLKVRSFKAAENSPDHKNDLKLQQDEHVSNQNSANAIMKRILVSEKHRPKSFEPGRKYKWTISILNKSNMVKTLKSVSNFAFSAEFKVFLKHPQRVKNKISLH
jgi:hypothetical protein